MGTKKYCTSIPITSRSREHCCRTDSSLCERTLDEKNRRDYGPTGVRNHKVPVEGLLGISF